MAFGSRLSRCPDELYIKREYILAPSGKCDGSIFAAAVMLSIATITVATYCFGFKHRTM